MIKIQTCRSAAAKGEASAAHPLGKAAAEPFFARYNGAVTIRNPTTGKHRTIQIRRQSDNAKFAPGQRIVELLTGPNNEYDYVSFGFVSKDGSRIHVWKNKKKSHRKYADLLERQEYWEGKGFQYEFERRCRRCDRRLTTPRSIEDGIGPTCLKRENGEA